VRQPLFSSSQQRAVAAGNSQSAAVEGPLKKMASYVLSYLLDWLRRRVESCKQLPLPLLTRFAGSLFFKEEMELSLIGLNAAGKTSLVNVIAVRSASCRRCAALTPGGRQWSTDGLIQRRHDSHGWL